MKSLAMSYPQLINQAMEAGYSSHELQQLAAAHQFALRMSEGFYRAQGVPLLCHLIRTASIVMCERKSPRVVIATLLHATYITSFFKGSIRQRPRTVHRKRVRHEFGAEVDELIWRYTKLPWYERDVIEQHIAQLGNYDEQMKDILVMRLANEVEDYLDKAMAYTNPERARLRLVAYSKQCVELARCLEVKEIAGLLSHCCTTYENISLPQEVMFGDDGCYELSGRRFWQAGFIERWLRRGMRTLKCLKPGTKRDLD